MGNLRRILNTSSHSTGQILRGFVCKLSRRIRELETRDCWTKSIESKTMRGVFDRNTVGIAEINSIFVGY